MVFKNDQGSIKAIISAYSDFYRTDWWRTLGNMVRMTLEFWIIIVPIGSSHKIVRRDFMLSLDGSFDGIKQCYHIWIQNFIFFMGT